MTKDIDRPIDLSRLDPTQDAERFDALVDDIMHVAAPMLEARRSARNVVGELARWQWPVYTAAAAAAAFLVVSFSGMMTPPDTTESVSGIAEAIGIPTQVASWIRGDTQPSVADIYEGIDRQ